MINVLHVLRYLSVLEEWDHRLFAMLPLVTFVRLDLKIAVELPAYLGRIVLEEILLRYIALRALIRVYMAALRKRHVFHARLASLIHRQAKRLAKYAILDHFQHRLEVYSVHSVLLVYLLRMHCDELLIFDM